MAASVASVLAQADVAVEVTVVDDASEEQPPLAFDRDTRVTRVRQPKPRGPSAARNRGVQRSRADWIAFVEDRDVWAPDHLATLVAACERNGADFGYRASWIVDDACRIRSFRQVPSADALAGELLLGDVIGTPSSVVVRREFWDRAGGFDEWLTALAPWDLWIRWSRAGRACMSAEPKVAAAEPEEVAGLQQQYHELRELRRRYVDDARRAGVRFGAAMRRRRRRWEAFLPAKTEEPVMPPIDASPPWLTAAFDAASSTNDSPA